MKQTLVSIKVAEKLVEGRFGRLYRVIIAELLRRGRPCMEELFTITPIAKKKITKALMILSQHNYVYCFRKIDCQTRRKTIVSRYVYVPRTYNIITLLRFPRILTYTYKMYGTIAEQLLSLFAEHGRLTADQCVKYATKAQAIKISSDSYLTAKKVSVSSFKRLIKDKLIDRVKQSEQGTKKMRTSETEIRTKCCLYQNGTLTKKRNVAGQKCHGFLWSINHRQFDLRFRLNECAHFTIDRHGKKSKHLVQALFNIIRRTEAKYRQVRSLPVQRTEIAYELDRLIDFKMDNTLPELVIVSLSSMMFVDHDFRTMDTIIDQYQKEKLIVNMRRIIELIRLQHIESVVLRRFGNHARRIIRHLLITGSQEQNHISEACIMKLDQVRVLLYRMMKEGFGQIDIPFSESHHTPDAVILWEFNIHSVTDQIRTTLWHTVLNLLLRVHYELFSSGTTVRTDFTHSVLKKTELRRNVLLGSLVLVEYDLLILCAF